MPKVAKEFHDAVYDENIALKELNKALIKENDNLRQQLKKAENDKWNYKTTIMKFQRDNEYLSKNNNELKNMFKKYLNEIAKHPTCTNAIDGIVEKFRQKLEEL